MLSSGWTKKGETGEEQSQEHTQYFLWCQEHCSLRIDPGRPNGEFHILMWLTATAWKRAKASPKLWWPKNWLLLHDNAPSHIFFITREFFTNPLCLPDLAPCDWLFSVFCHFDAIEVTCENHRLCWTPSQNTISRMQLKMAESLGTVHTRRRGLLWGWWWPLGPKLVFDQMATPVPVIMDTPSHIVIYSLCWKKCKMQIFMKSYFMLSVFVLSFVCKKLAFFFIFIFVCSKGYVGAGMNQN
jgi:hypothetical protein